MVPCRDTKDTTEGITIRSYTIIITKFIFIELISIFKIVKLKPHIQKKAFIYVFVNVKYENTRNNAEPNDQRLI